MLTDDEDTGHPVPANPIRADRPDWSMQLAVDVALGSPFDTVLETYQLQYHEYERILEDPVFCARVAEIKKELQKNGASFRLKAQLQAEELLKTSFLMIHNPDTPSSVRAQLIRDTVRWATWDNPPPAGGTGVGSGFSININLGGSQRQPVTIDAEPSV